MTSAANQDLSAEMFALRMRPGVAKAKARGGGDSQSHQLPQEGTDARPVISLNAHCFVRFAPFAAFKRRPTAYRSVNQQPQYQAERVGCAGDELVTKFSSKINSSESKIKIKIKLCEVVASAMRTH